MTTFLVPCNKIAAILVHHGQTKSTCPNQIHMSKPNPLGQTNSHGQTKSTWPNRIHKAKPNPHGENKIHMTLHIRNVPGNLKLLKHSVKTPASRCTIGTPEISSAFYSRYPVQCTCMYSMHCISDILST